ncbi:hypothetical protein BH11ARM2_BH11ARM2_26920 [soil metagenome]
MGYEIRHLHIELNSPEGQGLEAIISRDQVTPEEAVLKLLREASPKRNAALRMIGLFSSDEDAAIMDEVIELNRESRRTPTTRDLGL